MKFCKYILYVNTKTPNSTVYGELGRIPLLINVKVRMITFGAKMHFSLTLDKLTKKMYNLAYTHNFPWVKYIKSIYDKRDDFNFHITNFPFLSSNIPSSPAYGVFISQLIRYARACSSYECFILRARRLSSKLLKQGYLVERLKSSFRKFYGRYGNLIEQYEVTLSRMLNDILTLDQQ